MTQKLTLRPTGLAGVAEHHDKALSLAGGPLRFDGVEAILRQNGKAAQRRVLPVGQLRSWAETHSCWPEAERLLARLTLPRTDFAGLPLAEPQIMGVINVTPDSFSDGGDRFDRRQAIDAGLKLWQAGASIVDVGGESTRPRAEPVSLDQEMERVLPVIEALTREGVRVSIDSRNAPVMSAALAAGASLINDVTALTGDPNAMKVAADSGTPVILMHMQGEPRSMQDNPIYDDAALDVFDYLAERADACEAGGIPRERVAIDPGIGFGKNLAHNLRILEQLALFHGTGCPVLLGASRKSFIGRLSEAEAPKDRLPGSLAAVLAGAARGVQLFRVHDVAETKQALAVWQAIVGSPD